MRRGSWCLGQSRRDAPGLPGGCWHSYVHWEEKPSRGPLTIQTFQCDAYTGWWELVLTGHPQSPFSSPVSPAVWHSFIFTFFSLLFPLHNEPVLCFSGLCCLSQGRGIDGHVTLFSEGFSASFPDPLDQIRCPCASLPGVTPSCPQLKGTCVY